MPHDSYRLAAVASFALLTLAVLPGVAMAQATDTADLAVQAANTHETHCANMQGKDMEAAVKGFQEVAGVWGDIDAAMKASDTPQPYLLYWRGLLAQCLDKTEEATSDLEGFLKAAEFMEAVDEERHGQLQAMAADARRRIKQLRRGTGVIRPSATALTPQTRTKRGLGVAMLIAGGAAAGGGFALNAGMYHTYYQPSTTNQDTYHQARGAVTAGLVIGISGAAIGVTGLVVLVVPSAGSSRVALLPGPVPTLTVRF